MSEPLMFASIVSASSQRNTLGEPGAFTPHPKRARAQRQRRSHCMIDGKEAMQFLVAIKNYIEDPARLVMGI